MEPAAPITTYRLIDHAQIEMARRQIQVSDIERVLSAPEQTETVREGRVVYQARFPYGEPPIVYLLRVFVDVDRQLPEVVTVYCTRCPFRKYTASACCLGSFPRKRESRSRTP